MKNISLIFLSGIFFFSLKSSLLAGSNPGSNKIINHKEELLIQVPLASDKNHSLIKQTLLNYPGVKYNGKCLDNNLYFISVDRDIQPGNQFLEDSFRVLSLDYFIKTGTSQEKAIAECQKVIETTTTPASR
jgi:hypothetical protein